MSVGLYMDVHAPAAVSRGLRLRRVDIITAQEDGRRRASDLALLDRAMELGRVLFSQDEDFLIEAVRRQRNAEPFAGLIYLHQLNTIIGRCIADLEIMAKAGNPEDFANRIEYLPL